MNTTCQSNGKSFQYPIHHPIGNLVHVGLGYGVGFISDKLAQAIILSGFLLYEYSRVKPEVDKLIAVSEFLGGVWLGTSNK